MGNPRHNRGHAGEQSMGFYWGERGYFLVDGPSGAGGHAANAPGFDGVAYNPTTGHMVIYDNKAFARAGNVYSATAISENLSKNLANLANAVAARPDIPQQQAILTNINTARASLAPGSTTRWPRSVQLAVSNASGQSSGVGGKLANGTISFIDYYAAPAPAPPPAGGNSFGSNARTGSAWSGPSADAALQRFNARTSNIQGIGGAIQMLQQWASQRSAMNTYYEALDEIAKRANEIDAQQKRSPYESVVIKVFFKIDNENLPAEIPRFYRLIGVEIGGESLAHGDLMGPGEHGYTIRIPALQRNPAADAPRPEPGRSWQQRYDSFVGSLFTRGGNVADPEGALSTLNGLAMFDILPILKRLKGKEPLAFDKLQQALDWPSVGARIFTQRLRAAFIAVRASENAGAAVFQNYVASCRDFGSLPPAQQKDVEAFLTGAPPPVQAMDRPTGKWTVKVHKWTWIYTFDDFGNVSWVDPLNGQGGKGRWAIVNGVLRTTWAPSPTVEEWTLPLTPKEQTGQARMADGCYALSAEMVD